MGESRSTQSTISIAEVDASPVASVAVETGTEPLSELTSYLGNLGLGANHLAKVVSLLQATQGEVSPQTAQSEAAIEPAVNAPAPLAQGRPVRANPIVEKKTVGLFIAEEQQILMHAYQSFFGSQPGVELLGCSEDTSGDALVEAATTFKPDVMLLGVKALRASTVESLETLRDACPRLIPS